MKFQNSLKELKLYRKTQKLISPLRKYKKCTEKLLKKQSKLSNINFYEKSDNTSEAVEQKPRTEDIIKDNTDIHDYERVKKFNNYFINVREKLKNELIENLSLIELPLNSHNHILFLHPIS